LPEKAHPLISRSEDDYIELAFGHVRPRFHFVRIERGKSMVLEAEPRTQWVPRQSLGTSKWDTQAKICSIGLP
jgi:hypothetical protein